MLSHEMDKRILITGASGMVGFALCRFAGLLGYKVLGIGRTNRHGLDPTSFQSMDLVTDEGLEQLIESHNPDLLIHAAANTSHASCEQDPDYARELHVTVSKRLAAVQARLGKRFIYISTEAVYGSTGGIHSETDPCVPEGIYAMTKEQGERAVLLANTDALCLRVTPVGVVTGATGGSLAEWILERLASGDEVPGFADVFFSPISSWQLASFILTSCPENLSGVFNLACTKPLSKHTFAQKLATVGGYDVARICKSHKLQSPSIHQGGMTAARIANLGIWRPPTADQVTDSLKEMIQVFRPCQQNHV